MQVRLRTLSAITSSGLLALPGVAHAHSIGKQVGDFYWGFMHPVVALDSAFPILALGLLAGQSGSRKARAMLLLFSAGLLAGALLGLWLPAASFPGQVNLAAFIILGLLLASNLSLPSPLAASTALVTGVFQGWSNSAEISGGGSPVLFIGGLFLAAYLIVATAAASAEGLTRQGGWRSISVRVAGSWIAAIGLMILALP